MKGLHKGVAVLTGAILLATLYYFLRGDHASSTHSTRVEYNLHIRPILSDRCFKCHGPDARQRKADLRLDISSEAFAELKKNPGAHALVSGKPEASELYQRISSTDTAYMMPPPSSNLRLTTDEVSLIRRWIEQGAEYQPHWSLIPPRSSPLPEADEAWTKNEIDYFVDARLKTEGLDHAKQADGERLLRRLFLDLTGLPPTLEQQQTLQLDGTDANYEKAVDQLLASPHYGEKMAIAWLDVARYADSHGYQDDGLRTMWPWRDWVIHAFNSNYTYDKFITWQLAGDLLPNPSREMLLATGFNRNHKITQEGGVIDEEYRLEYVTDRTNTFGKTFLAMTLECAKCHDHKYDPISQRDYYRAFAFFNQVAEKGYQGDIYSGTAADPPRITLTRQDIDGILKFINLKDSAVNVMIMRDSTWTRPTHVLIRGAYDAPGDLVTAGMPVSILPFDSAQYPKNRLGLARWLLSERNPLTARVFVNRLWQEFFGRGIVKSSGDFGMQGDLPSHPELLDWLAVDFRQHGWDIKRLVKQMVSSATYRQGTEASAASLHQDPENILLSHAPRTRLSAELVHDVVLSSSGLLVDEIGGPSVKPYQPKGIWEASTSGRGVLRNYIQDHNQSLYRRGMYTFIKRTVPPPSLLVFDASNRDQCEVRRLRTNTPLQALVMMNDPMVLEAARVLSERLMQESSTADQKIQKAFRLILSREARPKEFTLLLNYYQQEQTLLAADKTKAEALLTAGEYPRARHADVAATASLQEVILMLYNLDETITKS